MHGPIGRKQVVARANWGAPVEFSTAKVGAGACCRDFGPVPGRFWEWRIRIDTYEQICVLPR